MSAVAFFIYLAQVSIYAAVLWGIYCAVWRSKPLLRGSRVYLLCSLVLPLVLPLIRVPVAADSAVAAYGITLPEVVIGGVGKAAKGEGFSWAGAGLWMYAAVTAALLLLYGRSYILLFRKLSHGERQKRDGYTLITGAGIGPGTIGKRIFFPADDVNAAILRHELGHIHAGHRYDAALMQVLHVALWASPAHWLMRRELKLVHEYEADRAAVSSPLDMTAYGELMLSQSLGIPNTSIAHSFFHHPLKLRINMLHAHQHPARRLRIYAIAGVLITLFSGAVVLAQTKKTKAAKPVAEREFEDAVIVKDAGHDTITVEDPVTGQQKTYVATKDDKTGVLPDGRMVYKTVEHMPEFNGDLPEWLSAHLTYPDAARKANRQGRSVVQFVVDETGTISNASLVRSSGTPLLDKEAMRAVAAMPRWKAGTQSGQAVPVYFTLPITFKLDK